jgi:terminase large subunit-like protein
LTTPTLERVYEARGAAAKLMSCRAPEVLVDGPLGTGKSRACLEKLHLMARKTPKFKGLIVRKTLVSLTASAIVIYKEQVIADELAAGTITVFGGSSTEPPGWRYSNGSLISMVGLDKPEKVQSAEFDAAYIVEATELTQHDWVTVSGRLRNGRHPYQQLLADCNPSHAKHWLKQRCDAGTTVRFSSKLKDNPRFYDADETPTEQGAAYEARMEQKTGVDRLRNKDGLWVSQEGGIYVEEWEQPIPGTHLIDPFPIPEDWPRYWVVDFGHTHPFVAQWWAEDDDGRLFMYREIYMTKRLVEDHARNMLRAVTKPRNQYVKLDADPEGLGPLADIDAGRRVWTEPEPFEVICDHDAEGRATLEKYVGFSTTAATKAVTEGIEHVQARMRLAGDGRPRLFLFKDALVELDKALDEKQLPTCTADEIPGYVWDESDGPNKKERPVKEKDDGCDAARYMVAHRDLGPGSPGIRYTS